MILPIFILGYLAVVLITFFTITKKAIDKTNKNYKFTICLYWLCVVMYFIAFLYLVFIIF